MTTEHLSLYSYIEYTDNHAGASVPPVMLYASAHSVDMYLEENALRYKFSKIIHEAEPPFLLCESVLRAFIATHSHPLLESGLGAFLTNAEAYACD